MSSPDRERWDRLERILDEAFDLEGEQRRAYLDRACEGQPELRRRVEALLRADERSDAFLERDAAELVGGWLDDGEPPERVGPYRVLREIGRGGMGTVYLAERADGQFEQRVALKLIRRGRTGDEARRRFLQERQILARIEHPNIARLLDGGVTDEGAPYFAMEHVEGRPITAYCDERRLDVDRRIELFVQVCDAVRYAHQSLIVHRDLKPSNILVTETGEVKLLDFGIAKLLDDAGPDPLHTRTAAQVMTPAYASPEQIRGRGVTTATDVYMLGLVLYELLTGRLPYRPAGTSTHDVQRAILDDEPLRPSRSLSDPTEHATSEEICRARATGEPQLRRKLDGDLDAILLKALRKEPEERYPSAEALRDDLARYRARLPVLAHRGNRAYLLRKYVQRHRGLAAAATVGAVSLTAGLVVAIWQAGVASAERDRALAAEARATAIKEFLVGEMLASAAPETALGREITVGEVLDEAAERIDGAFPERSGVEGSIRTVIGGTYMSLGRYDEARRHLEQAALTLREANGPDDPETLRAQAALAELTMHTGDYGRAERGFREVLATLRRSHPDAWRDNLHVRKLLVDALDLQRKNAEAERVCRETLALQRRHLGHDHPDTLRTVRILGNNLRRQEKLGEAEVLLEEALALQSDAAGPDHPDTLELQDMLGAIYHRQGRLEEVEALWRDLARRAERTLGAEHPRTLDYRVQLGFLYRAEGRFDEVERIYRAVLAGNERARGETHPQTIKVRKWLGALLHATGRQAEARPVFERVIEISERAVAGPAADATALNDFAWYLLTCPDETLHDPARARRLAERAVELTGRRQPEFLDTLAEALHRTGNLERAIEVQREVMALPDSVHRYGEERRMIRFLEQQGDPAAVEAFIVENLERRRRMREPADSLIGTSLRLLGLHYRKTGRLDEAERQLRLALEQFARGLPADHWRAARARSELGEVLTEAGRYDEAEAELLAAYETLRGNPNAREEERRPARERLIALYEAWGKPEQAARWR